MVAPGNWAKVTGQAGKLNGPIVQLGTLGSTDCRPEGIVGEGFRPKLRIYIYLNKAHLLHSAHRLTRDPSTNSETHPSVQTVSLFGSWDNFSKQHTMERDSRRDRGQWRGCHNFKGIVCDGDRPGSSRRNGGLKMGQPYYFYYELNGSVETHDPSLPSTSACPYLPGQNVNMMWMPNEQSERKRSASLSSIRIEDFKTMEPEDKFVTPRPAPPVPALPDFLSPAYRIPTAPAPSLKHKASDRSICRSISPTPSWWSPRKLFTRKHSTSSQGSGDEAASVWSEEQRCSITSSSTESSRVRAMSPESLRRFLSDDVVVPSEAEATDRLALSIPDDIAEEEDDDFVVMSAFSEFGPKTILSPPPPISRQNSSSNTLRRFPDNSSAVTLMDAPQISPRHLEPSATFYQNSSQETEQGEEEEEEEEQEEYMGVPTSRFSLSSDEGSVFGDDDERDPNSPSTENETPSFYHSDAEVEDDDDADCLSPPITKRAGLAMGRDSLEKSLAHAFEGYRLPQTSIDEEGNHKQQVSAPTRDGGEAAVSVVSSPPLLALPIIDDFVSELRSAGLSF